MMVRALEWLENSRGALLMLAALFVVPRVAILLLYVEPTSDAAWYFSRAAMLAAGRGYLGDDQLTPTAYWPPGWPLALGAVFRLTGEPSLLSVGVFNLLCSGITALLILRLGQQVSGSEAAARVAVLLYAIYPNAIGYVPLALTEVFYTALLLAGCWLLVGDRSRWALIPAGLLFGVATLVKAQSLVVVPLVLGIAALRAPNLRRTVPVAAGRTMLVLAVAALTVAPWTWRNQQQLGAAVTVSTNGGITLLTGNNDSAEGGFAPDDPVVRQLDARKLGELAHDAEAKRLGLQWIGDHPARFVQLIPRKLWRLWGPDGEAQWAYETGLRRYLDHAAVFDAVRLLNQSVYLALLAGFLAAAGLMVARRRREGLPLADWWLLPYGIALYPSAIAVVFSGQSRFHFPVMPFVCITCGGLVVDLLSRSESRWAPGRSRCPRLEGASALH